MPMDTVRKVRVLPSDPGTASALSVSRDSGDRTVNGPCRRRLSNAGLGGTLLSHSRLECALLHREASAAHPAIAVTHQTNEAGAEEHQAHWLRDRRRRAGVESREQVIGPGPVVNRPGAVLHEGACSQKGPGDRIRPQTEPAGQGRSPLRRKKRKKIKKH